jgi:hypothetical protein
MLVLEEILELEVGMVGPPSSLDGEWFYLIESKLVVFAKMNFSSLKFVEERYESYSFLHKSRSHSSLIISYAL